MDRQQLKQGLWVLPKRNLEDALRESNFDFQKLRMSEIFELDEKTKEERDISIQLSLPGPVIIFGNEIQFSRLAGLSWVVSETHNIKNVPDEKT